jgi:hypothetical protein
MYVTPFGVINNIRTKSNSLTIFSWQNGYLVFLVGKPEEGNAKSYIFIQDGHDRRSSFQDEYRIF